MSAPQYPTAPPSAPTIAAKGSNGLAVAGFVLGLLAALGSFIPVVNIVAIVLAVIGLVLAGVGLARVKKVQAGKGLAIAGIILAALAIIIAIVVNVAFGKAVDDAVHTTVDTHVKTPAGTKGGSGGDDVGHSRTSPAPLGSTITGGGWTVKINSVKSVSSDSLGQSAKPGKTLLLINLTATYNGHDSQGDSAWASVKYVAPNGASFDGTDSLFIPEHQFSPLKTAYHGASVTGNEMIQVPAADWQSGVLAVSPGILSDDTFLSLK